MKIPEDLSGAQMYAVFVRGTSQIFPEDFTHIAAAAETAGLADKSNIFSCIGKHITGCLYAVIFLYILSDSYAGSHEKDGNIPAHW